MILPVFPVQPERAPHTTLPGKSRSGRARPPDGALREADSVRLSPAALRLIDQAQRLETMKQTQKRETI
ncbi:MAG: hypothetical protein J0L97_08165 [Alphaproteobacteria bacterium]|nr:hypothetical protein [Alphaproteobacteria bacterium]